MSDDHISVIDMYDVNAKPADGSDENVYKAFETDITKDRQIQLRVWHGKHEGETLIHYSLMVRAKHRPLVRMLVDERLGDVENLAEDEYLLLREQIKQEVMMDINALETRITPLPLLEQIAEIEAELGMLEQLLLFDTNGIHILEGRYLDKLLEPIQDAKVRMIRCFSEGDEPPKNGEPIIVRVSEYEFGNGANPGQANTAQAEEPAAA
ncbi:MAG: hypothetical protein AAF702_11865 [Chloroflexota bacterium]